ncbi:DNA-directed RNA polymerase I subunit RPA12 [Brachypodium distachyon]|uniref:DNA-directed RNA polymerase subunit n=1 Tax=Brachypodium distachyon TaxID=15368 RepID=I1GP74_BRADI|nr:DNA-directed RNA polymerase I subunit RPA12 [Brachypodium distachyon]KQK13618.1 hypothetical protein BRADI_1g11365v3 [Brachypodium distachyon]|eukprot:XP_010231113.1 DNA-directed RNA polymerase I subunit RPA12 [Brachypodium distachyon]
MAFWQARDFLFCSVCGTLLDFDSVRSASCPLCGFKRKAKAIEGKETRYAVTDEDIRRELKIEPFVTLESAPKMDVIVQRVVVDETCPKCGHPQLEYHTKQLRAADEGQTVFYECPECRHNFKVNN